MFGSHLSIAGGLHNALRRREARHGDGPGLHEEPAAVEVQAARAARHRRVEQPLQAAEVQATVSHDSYLINLASTDEALWRQERRALRRRAPPLRSAWAFRISSPIRARTWAPAKRRASRRSWRRSTSFIAPLPKATRRSHAWKSRPGRAVARLQAGAPGRDHRARRAPEATRRLPRHRPPVRRRLRLPRPKVRQVHASEMDDDRWHQARQGRST